MDIKIGFEWNIRIRYGWNVEIGILEEGEMRGLNVDEDKNYC